MKIDHKTRKIENPIFNADCLVHRQLSVFQGGQEGSVHFEFTAPSDLRCKQVSVLIGSAIEPATFTPPPSSRGPQPKRGINIEGGPRHV